MLTNENSIKGRMTSHPPLSCIWCFKKLYKGTKDILSVRMLPLHYWLPPFFWIYIHSSKRRGRRWLAIFKQRKTNWHPLQLLTIPYFNYLERIANQFCTTNSSEFSVAAAFFTHIPFFIWSCSTYYLLYLLAISYYNCTPTMIFLDVWCSWSVELCLISLVW